MMTEDEAKTKWCPKARYGRWAANRDEGKPPEDVGYPNRCIGSACMAWRWHERKRQGLAPAGRADEPMPTHGYCGAFGKPESHS